MNKQSYVKDNSEKKVKKSNQKTALPQPISIRAELIKLTGL